MFKQYLLSSVAFRPEDGTGSGGTDETPEDERIEIEEDDDETPHDPEGDPEPDVEAAGETDDDADDAPAGDAAPAPRGRGGRDFGALRERARTQAEENARLTRRIHELERAQPAAQAVETPQQRADRMALMSPEDRIREEVQTALGRHEQNTNALMSQLMDNSDRTAFQSECTNDALARKLAPEVERRLADLRARGQNLPRSTVLTYLIGERVRAQRTGKKPARPGRDANTVRPARAGSDVEPSRASRRGAGDGTSDFERRYGDTPI